MDGYMSETKDGFYLCQIEDYMKFNYILKLIKKKYDCKVIQSISNSEEGLEDISIDNIMISIYWDWTGCAIMSSSLEGDKLVEDILGYLN